MTDAEKFDHNNIAIRVHKADFSQLHEITSESGSLR
jgi:hypothetical protein